MYQTYSLTRAFDADDMRAQTFTVSDDDAINCAHMLAAGFNTMSRNLMHTYVLAVVDTGDGRVFYDDKIETIKRDKPWSSEQTITFNPTAGDADTILTLVGDGETPTFTAAGKFSFVENATDDEVMTKAADDLAKASYGHIARSVLEAAQAELNAVKNVLFEAGCETIPADAGVRDLVHLLQMRDGQIEVSTADIEQRDVEIAGLVQERVNANQRIAELERRDEHERHARQAMDRKHFEQNEATRVELIDYVKRERAKWQAAEEPVNHEHMNAWFRGMIDVLARFLVATGEADADEGHAVARRLVEKPED